MSQNDLSIANQGFASFRSDLNSALQALGSTNSGTSAPSTTYANQLFYDTTNNILKIRNEDNDAFISLFTLDQTNDNIESLTINGALSAESLDLNGGELILDADNDTSITSDTDDRVDIKVAGSDIVHVTSTGLGIGTNAPATDFHVAGASYSAPTNGLDSNINLLINNTQYAGLGLLGANNGSSFIHFGDGDDMDVGQINYVHADNVMTFTTNTSEAMRIDSSGNVGIGTTSPDADLSLPSPHFNSGGTGNGIRFQNGNNDADAIIQSYYSGTNASDILSGQNVYLSTSASLTNFDSSKSSSYILQNTNGDIEFGNASSSAPSERMRIDSSGKVAIGLTSALGILDFQAGTGTGLVARNTGSSGHNAALFINANDTVGSIVTSGTSTAFNTSSDYRLKENVTTSWDATTRLKRLKPSRFNFKTDKDTTLDGFLAHEVSSIVPEAITGTKDEVDTDGNPVHQGIDQSKLVPLLTKALQEAVAKIETLETKVTALEGK